MAYGEANRLMRRFLIITPGKARAAADCQAANTPSNILAIHHTMQNRSCAKHCGTAVPECPLQDYDTAQGGGVNTYMKRGSLVVQLAILLRVVKIRSDDTHFRSSAVQSSPPSAPCDGDGKKLINASRIRRIPQAGFGDYKRTSDTGERFA